MRTVLRGACHCMVRTSFRCLTLSRTAENRVALNLEVELNGPESFHSGLCLCLRSAPTARIAVLTVVQRIGKIMLEPGDGESAPRRRELDVGIVPSLSYGTNTQ